NPRHGDRERRTRRLDTTTKGGTQMSTIGKKLAGVAVGSLLVLGLGGAGLAYAQTTDNSSPSTTSPSTSAPAQDPAHCPHGHGPDEHRAAGGDDHAVAGGDAGNGAGARPGVAVGVVEGEGAGGIVDLGDGAAVAEAGRGLSEADVEDVGSVECPPAVGGRVVG